jgi:glycosyltransferase involved in cell wall biosynthesis
MPTLSIVTPTCGRDTLWRVITQTTNQMGPDDEQLIILDGPMAGLREWLDDLARRDARIKILETPRTNSFGNAQRDLALQHAAKDFILFLDDDDMLTAGALDRAKRRLTTPMPHMFRLRERVEVLGGKQAISLTPNLRGSMMVVPNVPDLPKWDTTINGRTASQAEFTFMEDVAHKFGGQSNIVWCDDIIHFVPGPSRGMRPSE